MLNKLIQIYNVHRVRKWAKQTKIYKGPGPNGCQVQDGDDNLPAIWVVCSKDIVWFMLRLKLPKDQVKKAVKTQKEVWKALITFLPEHQRLHYSVLEEYESCCFSSFIYNDGLTKDAFMQEEFYLGKCASLLNKIVAEILYGDMDQKLKDWAKLVQDA